MKKISIILLSFLLVFAFALIGCEDNLRYKGYDFENNVVLVVITYEASLEIVDNNIKLYGVDDFPEAGCVSVREITWDSSEMIYNYIGELGYVDMQEVKEYIETNTLTSFDNYCRMFSLTLNKKSKRNVLNICDRLTQLAWVETVEPNCILPLL